jgi:hypothetical protein
VDELTAMFINPIVVTSMGEKMICSYISNLRVQTASFRNSQPFLSYLERNGITQTGENDDLPDYRVASGFM